MITTLVLGALSTLALLQQTDTTLSVQRGTRLDLSSMGGEVTVRAWNREAVRIVGDYGQRERIEVSATGLVVRVRGRSVRGGHPSIEFRITVPSWMDVEIGGTFLEADVEGVRGEVRVETVHGDIQLRGGRGFVSLRSVQGEVVVRDAEGRIEVRSVNGDVRVSDGRGPMLAETVNGDIVLDRIGSASVVATTTNGDVRYDGSIENDGRYTFTTHNGDLVVSVSEGTNATVSVATYNGEFESAFPVTLTETRAGGKRFTFVLGDGSARIQLDSFGGTIRLRRPRAGGPRRRR